MASKKAKGKRAKTRAKFTRKGSKVTVNKLLENFTTGQRVRIKANPSVHSGMPPKRYHGKTAVVKEKRGRAFVVELRIGKVIKQLIVNVAHLHLAREK